MENIFKNSETFTAHATIAAGLYKELLNPIK